MKKILCCGLLMVFSSSPLLAKALSDARKFEIYGLLLSKQIKNLDVSSSELNSIIKGIKSGVKGSPQPKAEAIAEVNQFLLGRFKALKLKENKMFFEKLKKNPKIKKTDSGLYYEILAAGDKSRARPSDSVKVHYTGTLVSGKEFDSSRARGNPATFPLGGVIKGFGEGLRLIGKGGRAILYIPADLGYGDKPPPSSGIEPGSTLIFDVELIEINPGATLPQIKPRNNAE